jgi:death-on-curing protein
MNYLTVDEVLWINEQVLGTAALRDRHLLESAVAQPQQSAGGQDAYPDTHTKAAALLRGLACNHGFVDGNKRTALLSTLTFYQLNGYHFLAEEVELLHLVLDVATRVVEEIPTIAEHLRKMVTPIEVDFE